MTSDEVYENIVKARKENMDSAIKLLDECIEEIRNQAITIRLLKKANLELSERVKALEGKSEEQPEHPAS